MQANNGESPSLQSATSSSPLSSLDENTSMTDFETSSPAIENTTVKVEPVTSNNNNNNDSNSMESTPTTITPTTTTNTTSPSVPVNTTVTTNTDTINNSNATTTTNSSNTYPTPMEIESTVKTEPTTSTTEIIIKTEEQNVEQKPIVTAPPATPAQHTQQPQPQPQPITATPATTTATTTTPAPAPAPAPVVTEAQAATTTATPAPAPTLQPPPPTSTTSFEEIQKQLKATLDHVEQRNMVSGFQTLSKATSAVVDHCEQLGLTSDDHPYNAIDREQFWAGLNNCWLYALAQRQEPSSEIERLTDQHLYGLREMVVAWADKLERYGLVDYEMGWWEADILAAIDAILAMNYAAAQAAAQAVVAQAAAALFGDEVLKQ
ncbi:hypothetical protein INT45_008301 [Circinella minor]|uniref:Uncharacterized protein n=1 Tax=Circinella minor TaxID=1195481 RepID=A0A8H7VKV4_9FUNG|nr:hypothetical protein INT45_008301 [Circinella minor]